MYKIKYLKYKRKYLDLKLNLQTGGKTSLYDFFFAKLKGSYSQIGQDLQVINYYNNKKNGYFIDVGANNGVTLSNTYLLEKKYGWTGICIEPLPSAFKKLKEVRNKTTICINKAVTNVTGQIVKFSVAKYDLLSGITEHLSNYKAKEIKKSPLQLIDVETITLADILDQKNAPSFIDYMSLDTEGTELIILNGFDFNRYKIGYINVEHNYKEPERTQIKKLLESKGYQYLRENRWDDDYIHESTVIGTYYYQQDYTKPIVIKRQNNDFSVSSAYWNDDTGTLQNGFLNWKRLGNGKIFYTHIDYGNGNIWHRDKRSNL